MTEPPRARPLSLVSTADGADDSQPERFVDAWERLVRSGAPPEALVELAFDRCYAMVFTVAHRITGSRWDAEDLAQGVFETFARKLKSVRDPVAIPGFLKTSAVRAAMRSAKRGRWIRKRRLLLAAEQSGPRAREGAVSAATVRQVLERLTLEERTAVILKFVEGHSHDEVARLMQVSVSTARRRLESARTRMNAMAGDPVSTAVLEQIGGRP